ncbi:MAG: PilZ domain-containing protein [Chitinivibrionales bacterium]|nr:PilZ domain-containing protein [Chitinivibrionales bacterium]
MTEKRTLERVRCYYYLKVYDKKSKKDIGSIIDISAKGMKIISENTFSVNEAYELRIKLPQGYIYGDYFDIRAETRWCKKNEQENYYEAGFKFLSEAHKGIYVIKMLIEDFKSNNLL